MIFTWTAMLTKKLDLIDDEFMCVWVLFSIFFDAFIVIAAMIHFWGEP